MVKTIGVTLSCLHIFNAISLTFAGPQGVRGTQMMMMGGGCNGGGGMQRMSTIHSLLDNHQSIHREVNMTDDGVETYTWSENVQVSGFIKEHVAQMMQLVEDGGRIRCWDPLFAALFDHRDEITKVIENDEDGVNVKMSGTTACGWTLAQLHAEVVSDFVRWGRSEVHEYHDVPAICND